MRGSVPSDRYRIQGVSEDGTDITRPALEVTEPFATPHSEL
jgi:hypothetical protein